MEKLPKFIQRVVDLMEANWEDEKSAQREVFIRNELEKLFPDKSFFFGSSRFCFYYRNRCYKFAYNNAGIGQNNVEYNVYFNADIKYRKYIAKIYRTHWLFNVSEIVDEQIEELKLNNYIFNYLEQNFDLYYSDLIEQIGLNKKGKVKIYDYGFNKQVYQKHYQL